jgi:archaemetzincin
MQSNYFYFLVTGLFLLGSCSLGKKKTIGIQPYDNFSPQLLDTISKALELTYQMPVIILENKKIPESAFTNVKSPRYRADTLLKVLKSERPEQIDIVVGMTHHDISFTKSDSKGNIKKPVETYKDWGIMGLANRPGVSAVVSTKRLMVKSESLVINRLKKVTIHEVGHTLGLAHCDTPTCVMRDAAETVKTVDLVMMELCEKCKKGI